MDAILDFFSPRQTVVSITGIRSAGKKTLATALSTLLASHMSVEIRADDAMTGAGCLIIIGPAIYADIRVFVDCDKDIALCRRAKQNGSVTDLFTEYNDAARTWRAAADVIVPNNAAGISPEAVAALAAFVRMR